MVSFSTWIPNCDSHSHALLDLFLSSDASICPTMAFTPMENSDHVIVSVSIDFPSNSQRDALFHCIAYDYSHADWNSLCNHLRALCFCCCQWVLAEVDVYTPHRKYQVKPHSSPWFSDSCAAIIIHRNHFFRLHQKDKSSDSKVKFRQAGNCCKRVLEAAKLAYANETKEFITSQKLGFCDFW